MSRDAAPVEIRRVRQDEIECVHALLASHGWKQRIGELPAFAELIAASSAADVAILEGQVVGFVRAISDGLSNGYLSMVVVDAAHRGRGIGRRLVEHVIGEPSGITWVLRAGREGACGFFSALGFETSSIAMERRRR